MRSGDSQRNKDFFSHALPFFALLPYPLYIKEVELPNGPFRLYTPVEEQVPIIYQEMLETQPEPVPFPYWARLWPSALALAAFIQRHPHYVAGMRVAELGAGLGLPSLVAASMAQSVWCSDHAPEAMEVVDKSSRLHGFFNLHTAVCPWHLVPDSLAPEVLLLSDVNYDPQVFDSLLEVLQGYLYAGTTLLLATPQRLMARPFVERLQPWCTHQQQTTLTDADGDTYISILVLEAG